MISTRSRGLLGLLAVTLITLLWHSSFFWATTAPAATSSKDTWKTFTDGVAVWSISHPTYMEYQFSPSTVFPDSSSFAGKGATVFVSRGVLDPSQIQELVIRQTKKTPEGLDASGGSTDKKFEWLISVRTNPEGVYTIATRFPASKLKTWKTIHDRIVKSFRPPPPRVFTTSLPRVTSAPFAPRPTVSPATIPPPISGPTSDVVVPNWVPGISANSSDPDALKFTTTVGIVRLPIRSNGGIRVEANPLDFAGGVSYVSSLSGRSGASINPAPVKDQSFSVLPLDLEPYRPGGKAAQEAGSAYLAVDSASCAKGEYSLSQKDLSYSMVFVPCSVRIKGNPTSTISIVAAGSIAVSSRLKPIRPFLKGVALISGAATPMNVMEFSALSDAPSFTGIRVEGNTVVFAGALLTSGDIQIDVTRGTFTCGFSGRRVSIEATELQVGPYDIAGGFDNLPELTPRERAC
jgi:hypothetical protein